MELDQNGFPVPVEYEPTLHEATIWLTRGYSALVDAVDVPILSSFSWYAHVDLKRGRVYARHRSVGYMHRFLVSKVPGWLVDHKNGDPLDNRKGNLRLSDHHSNAANHAGYGMVSYRGVSPIYCAGPTRYRARIKVGDGRLQIGNFKTAELAARAYDRAARKHFGEFAWQNFPRQRKTPETYESPPL